jgi:formylglycine-generating enzyme required for sulfatase activity
VWIPSENDWYKAAYDKPTDASYSLYPTQSNVIPSMATADASGDISNSGTNVANYNYGAAWNGQDGNVTTVGSAGIDSASFYGTFDQGGNVWEWNDAIISSSRELRGGSWADNDHNQTSSDRTSVGPLLESTYGGFRVASVPEPTSVVLTIFAGGMMLARRRR